MTHGAARGACAFAGAGSLGASDDGAEPRMGEHLPGRGTVLGVSRQQPAHEVLALRRNVTENLNKNETNQIDTTYNMRVCDTQTSSTYIPHKRGVYSIVGFIWCDGVRTCLLERGGMAGWPSWPSVHRTKGAQYRPVQALPLC